MSDDEQLFSKLFARVRVVFTSLNRDNVPIFNMSGLMQNINEAFTESIRAVPAWGALGLFARPKPPDQPSGDGCSGFGVRLGDVVYPIALLDRRLARALGALPDWAIALAGYRGQKIILDSQGDGGRILIQHGPHVIEMNRNNGTLTITVGDLGSPAPVATIQLDSAGVHITGPTAVTGAPGGEAGAIPVLVSADGLAIAALIANMNALVPLAAAGGVTLTPITPGAIVTSSALKSTPDAPPSP